MKNREFIFFFSKRLGLLSGGNRSRTAAYVALTGISLSVFTMLITISIVTGFKQQIKERLLAFDSPLYVNSYEYNGKNQPVTLDHNLKSEIEKIVPESKIYAVTQVPAILKSESDFSAVMLQTLPDSAKKEFFKSTLTVGEFPSECNEGLILSRETMNTLQIDSLQRIDVLFLTENGLKLRRLNIHGIYDTYFSDYDSRIGFVTESIVQSIFHNDSNTGTRINIEPKELNIEELPSLSTDLYRQLTQATYSGRLTGNYSSGNLSSDASSYLAWLSLLDTNVVILIILMTFIAFFTLIGSVIIIVIEKVPQIGILKALGCHNSVIQKIFLSLGTRLLIYGILISNVISIVIIILQNKLHFLSLNPEVYYLAWVPMKLSGAVMFLTDICALLAGFLCLFLPVRIINNISPGKTLNFM